MFQSRDNGLLLKMVPRDNVKILDRSTDLFWTVFANISAIGRKGSAVRVVPNKIFYCDAGMCCWSFSKAQRMSFLLHAVAIEAAGYEGIVF
jgi:hypothetical protein